MVSPKLLVAVLTFGVLVELQIYAYKFNRSPDMLGYYLRRLVDSKQAMPPAPALRPSSERDVIPLTR
jgi:hypothetical protein